MKIRIEIIVDFKMGNLESTKKNDDRSVLKGVIEVHIYGSENEKQQTNITTSF
jgi:hypothetical protein